MIVLSRTRSTTSPGRGGNWEEFFPRLQRVGMFYGNWSCPSDRWIISRLIREKQGMTSTGYGIDTRQNGW
jgi:hypothetical protein